MTCPDCEEAKQHMKAQGFRSWRNHACFEHAACDWMPDWYVPDEANIRAAAKQMRTPYVGPDGPLSTQSDLFGAAS